MLISLLRMGGLALVRKNIIWCELHCVQAPDEVGDLEDVSESRTSLPVGDYDFDTVFGVDYRGVDSFQFYG